MKFLLCERIILNVLSFDLIVEQPYNAMLGLTRKLGRIQIVHLIMYSRRCSLTECMEICK